MFLINKKTGYYLYFINKQQPVNVYKPWLGWKPYLMFAPSRAEAASSMVSKIPRFILFWFTIILAEYLNWPVCVSKADANNARFVRL